MRKKNNLVIYVKGYLMKEMREYYRRIFIEDCTMIMELANKIIGDEAVDSPRTKIDIVADVIDLAGFKSKYCGKCNTAVVNYSVNTDGLPKAKFIDSLGNDFSLYFGLRRA